MFIRLLARYASVFSIAAISTLVLQAQPAKPKVTAQPLDLPTVAHVMDCTAMTSTDVSQAVGAPTVITTASIVDDGKAVAYCKLQIVVDDYARFELHLPVSEWTQRLLFGGGPGAQVAQGMKLDRFVTASWQDLGRRGKEDDFADNFQFRVNNGYRGMHLQVLAAKALVAKFYGQAPKFSYYNACSEPGREGMMEVQRFPEDFDGVGAGCPPINITINNGIFSAWNVLTNTAPDGKPIITADQLPVLHHAVLDQCDAADGLKDGIINDPLSCHPNLSAVQCKIGQDAATCLSSEQVRVATELYLGAHDSEGHKLLPIGVLPGSELAWTATIVPDDRPGGAREQATTALRGQYYDPPKPATWQLAEFRFDRASFEGTTKDRFVFDATNPDLSGFAKAGHKLILWQALGDTNVLPAQAILYYTALQKQMGASTVDGFTRFYVLPGVYHCGGGDGPVISDLLKPLMLWVERGIAPGVLEGVHIPRPPRGPTQGAGFGPGGPGGFGGPPGPPLPADLTRPIYPYPYTAKYIGTGDVKDAANYVQGPATPALPASLFDWLGSDFYNAGYQKWCTGSGASYSCKDKR